MVCTTIMVTSCVDHQLYYYARKHNLERPSVHVGVKDDPSSAGKKAALPREAPGMSRPEAAVERPEWKLQASCAAVRVKCCLRRSLARPLLPTVERCGRQSGSRAPGSRSRSPGRDGKNGRREGCRRSAWCPWCPWRGMCRSEVHSNSSRIWLTEKSDGMMVLRRRVSCSC
jgi:hypothetical protein